MDMNINMKCRLCLMKTEDAINIFGEAGERLNVANILAQHFWFDTKEDDSNSKHICMGCWKKVESFHTFYVKISEIHNFLLSNSNKVEVVFYSNYEGEVDESKDTLKNIENESTETNTSIRDNKPTIEIDDFMKNEVDDDVDKDNENFNYDSDIMTESEEDDIESEQEEEEKKPAKKTSRRKRSSKKAMKIKKDPKIDPEQRIAEDQQIRDYFKMDCELCHASFSVFQDVKTHYRKKHTLNGFLSCCDKKFFKRVYVLEHIQRHLNPDAFKCHMCNKLYADKRCLLNHMDSHRPAGEKPFQCTKCPKSFAKKFKLTQHMNIHITENEKSFFCEECGKAFSTKHILQSHKKGVHDGAYIHICEICAKVFKSKMFYEKHCQTSHSETPLPKVQCQQCGVWLKHEHGLRSHMKRHEEADKLFICNICGKQSPTQSALRSHKRYVHISQRIHKCTYCEKSFKQTISLKEHMTTHTGEVLYTCPHCPKTFNSSANMHSHKKKMHVKEWEESRNKT